ncbi:hypothetical protein [Caballeronia concitans]|uniref:Uncharacterized protein n=1 Tax=Caballeronia concitans TaxID=1777133 RepID=A0A658R2L9_9BURK|nr:hypothetical protein [Caballeronia concitans]KIG04568.1 hypothetical protein BurMR1_3856 [Burkholderia sp. MR1]SAL41464.1 hypothetical protein AWB72_04346 [Caballeronia concitans]
MKERDRATQAARAFLADSFKWEHDQAFISRACTLLELDEDDVQIARWKVRRAIESGELLTIPDAPSSGLRGSRGDDAPRPRSVTFTPSQLFSRGANVTAAVRTFTPSTLRRLPADDFFAIMAAKPGDVLPDGRIATALTDTALSDAAPFDYVPEDLGDDVMDVAASTTNPDYAAKMLGYDRDEFGDMIHVMKAANQLRGDDNVVWHDNGDVYFNGNKIDNMHSY